MTVEAYIDKILEGIEGLIESEKLSASVERELDESISRERITVGRDEETPEEKISEFWKQVNSLYSGGMMTQPLNKKTAARICHIFMKGVFGIPDVDWHEAAKLKDIYECRLCANAIAQVYERGIIPPRDCDVFGINDEMSDEMISDVINSLL